MIRRLIEGLERSKIVNDTMSDLWEWKDVFSKVLGEHVNLGVAMEEHGYFTSRQCERSEFALEYVTHLVPRKSINIPPFRIFGSEEIEENLNGLCYSIEFQNLAFLPIGEFENDKILCIDCEFSGFVVLQLGLGTVQPLRRFMLFRCNQFSDLLAYIEWKSGRRISD